ncbi:MAG: MotA/TolQ/ExbB proton channel family protein [Kiritimatiellae bacterium]|nr:MotA/TolQ/ExbB proton channel family protein [Kiritimatiellia bacterium]MDD5520332.1 MotA/TolQ/ExbB proton channel family protein [Kiritimatiellia bacterium]
MFLYLLKESGPVGWVIIACGIVAFIVFVERGLHLHRARIKADDFLKGIFNILGRKNIPEALMICDETPGPVAYLVKTAILHRDESRDAIRSAVDDASMAEISRMERRLVVIATVAQIAPLLGLLGTVLAMVQGLLVMQQQTRLIQSVDIMGLLMQALICTGFGLTTSIPCYAAFNLLVVKIDRIVLDMERAASGIVAFLTGAMTDSTEKKNV